METVTLTRAELDAVIKALQSALHLEASIDPAAWYSSSECPNAMREIRAAERLLKAKGLELVAGLTGGK